MDLPLALSMRAVGIQSSSLSRRAAAQTVRGPERSQETSPTSSPAPISARARPAIASRETAAALSRLVPSKAYFVTREDPVRIPGRCGMPEPDISVVRGRSRDYIEQPDAGDVPLIVEVSDKTLAFDRTDKLGSYAGGGIPVYWIVNLVDRQVEVYTGPGPDGYSACDIFTADQSSSVGFSTIAQPCK